MAHSGKDRLDGFLISVLVLLAGVFLLSLLSGLATMMDRIKGK